MAETNRWVGWRVDIYFFILLFFYIQTMLKSLISVAEKRHTTPVKEIASHPRPPARVWLRNKDSDRSVWERCTPWTPAIFIPSSCGLVSTHTQTRICIQLGNSKHTHVHIHTHSRTNKQMCRHALIRSRSLFRVKGMPAPPAPHASVGKIRVLGAIHRPFIYVNASMVLL